MAELTSLLYKADAEDFRFLAEQVASKWNRTDDKRLAMLADRFADSGNAADRDAFIDAFETALRYLADHELTHLLRRGGVLKGDAPTVHAAVTHVAKRMKIKLKHYGTLEGRLEQFSLALTEREFKKLTPEKQREILASTGLPEKQRELMLEKMKSLGPAAAAAGLQLSVGSAIARKVLEQLIITILSGFLGREVARELLKQIARRIPSSAIPLIGPALLIGSAGWTAWDLAGPALRKLVPVFVYLGIIGLRDGVEKE